MKRKINKENRKCFANGHCMARMTITEKKRVSGEEHQIYTDVDTDAERIKMTEHELHQWYYENRLGGLGVDFMQTIAKDGDWDVIQTVFDADNNIVHTVHVPVNECALFALQMFRSHPENL